MRKEQRMLSVVLAISFVLQPLSIQAGTNGFKGFKEIRKERYKEDVLHTYRHEKSGLEVIWIENKDKNMAFTLGVKTPAKDDTGVNHIIEHTLFTGSEKYPSSSLFFDANEAYPCTFMNAMTSGDMTLFPFATPYEACYKALLSIYLDAIFKPQLLVSPYGFYEEGFHKVPEENRIGGVVYNEMKGAFANMDRTIYRQLRKMIFKGTHYSYDSGGNPNAIPALTYEQCLATYKAFYYPGNMKIILYGNIPIEETMQTIGSYLKDYQQARPAIDLGVSAINETHSQEVKALRGTDKACIIKAFVLDDNTQAAALQDLDLWMAAYLMGTQSYLQMGLSAMGLHTKWLKDDDVPYPVYALVISDVPVDKTQRISQEVEALINQAFDGVRQNVFLEQDMLQETRWLLERQEASNTRGINIAQSMLDSWAHNREIDQYFMRQQKLAKLRHLEMSVGEQLLREAQRYTLFLLPQEEEELMPPEELTPVSDEAWDEIYEGMKAWQGEKNPLEPVALKQLILTPEDIPVINQIEGGWTMETRTEVPLVRSQLYLNTSHIPQKDLPYLFLYSYLLEESAKDITPFSGTLTTQCTAYPLKEGYWPCFRLVLTTLPEETEHGVLFNEARSSLMHRQKGWYTHELIDLVSNMRAGVKNNAIGTLAGLSMAGQDERSAYLYQTGYPFYCFCKNLLNQPEEEWLTRLETIDETLYHKGGLILSTILKEEGKNKYAASWEQVIEQFKEIPNLKGHYTLAVPKGDCFVETETAVDYSFKTLYKKEGISGEDYLIAAYLTKNYLNPELRVKLGAYGAGCQVYNPKTMGIYAYRAPDYRQSLQVANRCAAYLKAPLTEETLARSKAEALSRIHDQYKLLNTSLEAATAMEQLILWGKSPNELMVLQEEVLKATPKKIQEQQARYEQLLQEGKAAVMTGKSYTNLQSFTSYRY